MKKRSMIFVAAAALAMPRAALADDKLCTIPPGTNVKFHLVQGLASNESKTGQTFDFELIDPIATTDCAIPAAGTKGAGTLLLAGASGPHGHEGDLTMTLDTLHTADGRLLTFDDQVIEINGSNRKAESVGLNFVPDAGIAAIFIRGKDIKIDPSAPVSTVLLHPAIVRKAPASAPSPAPLPSP